MKNNKGFAIIETLITTVVLATALISLYVLFNNMMVKEKRRVYYDDPLFVVRSNYIFDLFFNLLKTSSTNPNYLDNIVVFDDLMDLDKDNEEGKEDAYLISFSCDNDIFENKADCQNFFYQFQLYKVYISKFDTSYTRICEDSNELKCITYNLLNSQTKLYIRSLPYVPGAKGYYVIFEFISNGDDNVCDNEDCMRQYASIKYGGDNTVIKLK